MIIQVISTFIAVIAVSIIYGVRKKLLPYCGLVGAVGWLVYLALDQCIDSKVLRMFFAALCVALISHILARIFKAPVTLFLIPGILPVVPGIGMYNIVYHMIIGNTEMVSFYFSETLQIAGVIALAIFIMDTIFRLFQKS